MSESHKYYYMKLKETFFNDSKILLLEQMQDGPLYILLLLKFYLISLPYNGLLLVSENMPHKERDRDKVRVREKEGQPIRSAFGAYQNVFLSDSELVELQNKLPTSWKHYIDRLSEYMTSSGRQYQNHAATIRRWAAADQKKSHQQTYSRDYSVEEGETV